MGVKRCLPRENSDAVTSNTTSLSSSDSSSLLEDLVVAIENRVGSRANGGAGQYNHLQLEERLNQVLLADSENNTALEWLRQPLIQGFIRGTTKINRKIVPPATEEEDEVWSYLPILYWLCQWKYLRQAYGWQGSDDFVLLALRAGATIEPSNPENTNTTTRRETILAGAIQYGTVNTLKHLIGAIVQRGGNAKEWVTSQFIVHTLWPKLLERACPDMLELLLRYVPATERVWLTSVLPDAMILPKGPDGEVHVTAVDYMLHKLNIWCTYPDADTLPCTCWNVVGAPHVQEFAACIILLMKKGVCCTPMTMTLISRFLSFPATSVPRQYAYTIAQLFFGNWFPSKVDRLFVLKRPHSRKIPDSADPEEDICVICLENNKKDALERTSSWFSHFQHRGLHQSTTRLYCGHSFCTTCILEWGASEPEINTATRTWELGCPICRQPLPREFLSESNRSWFFRLGDRRRNTLGLDHHPVGRGPQWLTPTQITMECNARGLSVEKLGYETSAQELSNQWESVKQQRRNGPSIMVDLGASQTLSPHYVAPKQGPVVIPIFVQGHPVLAGISGASPYTVVSPYLVSKLGLATKGLMSDQFQKLHQDSSDDEEENAGDTYIPDSALKKKRASMAVIDELIVTLGDSKIDVRLRNTIMDVNDEAEHDQAWRPGIVLGLDFLESAAWTQLAVEVDVAQSISTGDNGMDDYFTSQRFMVILHGGQNIHRVSDISLARKMAEELRYYAFSGRTFRTPLLHIETISDDDDDSAYSDLFFSVGHAHTNPSMGTQRQRFTECEWCCRMFPSMTNTDESTSGDMVFFSRNNARVFSGMLHCTFCHDMASTTKQYVYYCDSECQQKALEVHRWRHQQYRSSLISGCYIVLTFVIGTLRKEWKSFVFWFLFFFIGTFAAIRSSRGKTVSALIHDGLPISLYETYNSD